MCASTMILGPVVPWVAMIEPMPSKVIEVASGFICSTITLRIGSSKPGAPAVSARRRKSSTVRSCAPSVTPKTASAAAVRVSRRRVMGASCGVAPRGESSRRLSAGPARAAATANGA